MEPVASSIDGEQPSAGGHSEAEPKQRLLGVLVGVVLFNLLWFVFQLIDGSDGGRGQTRWPSHLDVWRSTRELLSDGFLGETLFSNTGQTLVRVIASLASAAVLGGGLGAAMGSHKKLRNLLDPFVSFMRLMTPVFVLSMSLLFIGIGSRTIIFTVGFVTSWFVADGVANALASVGSTQQRHEALVQLARNTLLITWLLVAFAELIGTGVGLGSVVWSARNFDRTGLMLAMTIWSTMLFLAVDYGIRLLGRALRPSSAIRP